MELASKALVMVGSLEEIQRMEDMMLIFGELKIYFERGNALPGVRRLWEDGLYYQILMLWYSKWLSDFFFLLAPQ